MKCRVCGRGQMQWAMQPFGPDNAPTFTTPGSHYRGFPVVPCCDACKGKVQAGEAVDFNHKGRLYRMAGGRVLVLG